MGLAKYTVIILEPDLSPERRNLSDLTATRKWCSNWDQKILSTIVADGNSDDMKEIRESRTSMRKRDVFTFPAVLSDKARMWAEGPRSARH